MAIDVIKPKMGECFTEGTFLEWKKNIGENFDTKKNTSKNVITDSTFKNNNGSKRTNSDHHK